MTIFNRIYNTIKTDKGQQLIDFKWLGKQLPSHELAISALCVTKQLESYGAEEARMFALYYGKVKFIVVAIEDGMLVFRNDTDVLGTATMRTFGKCASTWTDNLNPTDMLVYLFSKLHEEATLHKRLDEILLISEGENDKRSRSTQAQDNAYLRLANKIIEARKALISDCVLF